MVNSTKKKLLILSTSLFTNRLFSQSFLNHITSELEVEFWTFENILLFEDNKIEKFPSTLNNGELINFLRRINECAWITTKNLKSIQSMQRFNRKNFSSGYSFLQNILGKIISLLNLHIAYDKFICFLVSKQKRSEEARKKLTNLRPDAILVTNPFWMHESAVAVEAKSLGISIFSLIPSWDNITTKSRLTFLSDAYFVWSEIRKKELNNIYPGTKLKSVFIYGTPQYEVFKNQEFHLSRELFCEQFGLDPKKKIILFATGSPNFIKTEYDAATVFQQEFEKDSRFTCHQLLIRPHPNKDNNELQHLHNPQRNTFVHYTVQAGLQTEQRHLDKQSLILWINTFRHSDVVINLSSTVTLDAIACGKPVINLNFDISRNFIYDSYIKEINSTWTHLQDIWNCRGITQVNSISELKEAIFEALAYPDKGKPERDELFLQLCGDPNERHGKKLAETLISLVSKN